MKEPSPRASRLALAAGLVAAIVIGGGGFLLGQRSVADETPLIAPAPAAAPLPAPTPTEEADRTLYRPELIALASKAADATARGAPMPSATGAAVGKQFSIALPFGCDGPSAVGSDAAMRWRYDDKAEVLRLHVAPVSWSPTEWWAESAPASLEAIEGFWIARPWTDSEDCPPVGEPAAASGADPITLPGQTLAIGQLFSGEGARQGRRGGKAYTVVVRMIADEVRAGRGFRVRLAGHVAAVPGGGAASCRQPGGAEQRPICIIATTLDEVAIENAATGETLATWTVAGAHRTG